MVTDRAVGWRSRRWRPPSAASTDIELAATLVEKARSVNIEMTAFIVQIGPRPRARRMVHPIFEGRRPSRLGSCRFAPASAPSARKLDDLQYGRWTRANVAVTLIASMHPKRPSAACPAMLRPCSVRPDVAGWLAISVRREADAPVRRMPALDADVCTACAAPMATDTTSGPHREVRGDVDRLHAAFVHSQRLRGLRPTPGGAQRHACQDAGALRKDNGGTPARRAIRVA